VIKPGVFRLIPEQKTKHGMALAKLSRIQKNSFQKSKTKVVLATFIDSQGIIHTEFIPPCQAVNKK
jgi:hypothetical protein